MPYCKKCKNPKMGRVTGRLSTWRCNKCGYSFELDPVSGAITENVCNQTKDRI